MHITFDVVTLIGVTFFAAIVNGALGYGFSSLTVPILLLFYSNRTLNPALVLVEIVVNAYTLLVNRSSFANVWKKMLPIVGGLIPGIIVGSYILASVHPGWIKLFTYSILLPLIFIQAAGWRRPIQAERIVGIPFGAGVGALYAVTTISGPPLVVMFNNQGLVKEQFRAALGFIRMIESSLTAIVYYFLGLYSVASIRMFSLITPSVILGLPIGVFLIKRMNAETFRRICMSFDAWIIGFGLARVLIDLKILESFSAYLVWLIVIGFDLCLLYTYFKISHE